MGTAVIVRSPDAGPPASPYHYPGVDGADHRWIPAYADYDPGEILATLPDLVGDRNLALSNPAITVLTAEAESTSGLLVARWAAEAVPTLAALIQNTAVDMPSAGFSFVAVIKLPDGSSGLVNVDGFSITRAGNKNYTLGGGGGTAATTAGAQTDGWAVCIASVQETAPGSGLYTPKLTVNSLGEVTGSNATRASQKDRVTLGQNNTTARASAREVAEVTTWPFALNLTQKAAVLAAMRAKWSFVPQS